MSPAGRGIIGGGFFLPQTDLQFHKNLNAFTDLLI